MYIRNYDDNPTQFSTSMGIKMMPVQRGGSKKGGGSLTGLTLMNSDMNIFRPNLRLKRFLECETRRAEIGFNSQEFFNT